MITFDNLKTLINHNQYKVVKVYSGLRDHKTRSMMDLIRTETPEALITRLEEYQNAMPGKYILILGISQQAVNKHPRIVKVDLLPNYEDAQVLSTTLEGGNPKSIEMLTQQITLQVRQEIRKEAEQEAKENEVINLKAELAEMKTGAGKLSFLITEILGQVMPGMSAAEPVAAAMQGEQYSKEELDQALKILVKSFGAAAIINLANSPEKINTLKAFI